MKKGVTITLDKPRTLRYGTNALGKIEDLTGKNLFHFDLESIGVKDLLAIVYVGLVHEDPSLTLDQVGDLIDDYSSLTDISKALGEALTEAFGKGDANPGE